MERALEKLSKFCDEGGGTTCGFCYLPFHLDGYTIGCNAHVLAMVKGNYADAYVPCEVPDMKQFNWGLLSDQKATRVVISPDQVASLFEEKHKCDRCSADSVGTEVCGNCDGNGCHSCEDEGRIGLYRRIECPWCTGTNWRQLLLWQLGEGLYVQVHYVALIVGLFGRTVFIFPPGETKGPVIWWAAEAKGAIMPMIEGRYSKADIVNGGGK